MSHTADQLEATPERTLTQSTAGGARQALSEQAALELSSPPTAATTGDNQQQAVLMAQQGLKDLAAGDAAKGILELMRASIGKPDLIQDQSFVANLHQIAPDSAMPANHLHDMQPGLPQQQEISAPASSAQASTTADSTAGNGSPAIDAQQGLQQQTMAIAQQGLAEIAAGNGTAGILKLMSAAQLNPAILQDSRFINALQSALAAAQSPRGNAVSDTGVPIPTGGSNRVTGVDSAVAPQQNLRAGAS